MSRLSFTSKAMPSTKVCFGLDLAGTQYAGYWVQVWEDGKDEPIIDRDTRGYFDNSDSLCSRGEILDILNHHGCDEKYVHRIAMDLDPAG